MAKVTQRDVSISLTRRVFEMTNLVALRDIEGRVSEDGLTITLPYEALQRLTGIVGHPDELTAARARDQVREGVRVLAERCARDDAAPPERCFEAVMTVVNSLFPNPRKRKGK